MATINKKSINIAIINLLGVNIGDMAIYHSMINSLNQVFPNAEYFFFGYPPDLIKRSLKKNNVYNNLSYPINNKLIQILNIILLIRNLIWIFFNNIGINLFFLCEKETRDALYKFAISDIIISSGGGYLNDNSDYGFLGHLIDIYLGTILNKPVILYAQSIGPFKNKFLMLITKMVLKKVDLIILRDNNSMKYINKLGIKNVKIVITADEALLLPLVKKGRLTEILNRERIESSFITVAVKPWHFPHTSNPELYKQKYINAMVELISHIINEHQIDIIFIPMYFNLAVSNETSNTSNIKKIMGTLFKIIYPNQKNEFDIDVINEIISRVNSERLKILKEGYGPCEIKSIINMSEMLISARMHPAIFALAQNIPVLGISYEPKMISLMNSVEQQHFNLEINEVNSDDLIKKLNLLWAEKKTASEVISKNIHSLMNNAAKNKFIIFDYFYEIKKS